MKSVGLEVRHSLTQAQVSWQHARNGSDFQQGTLTIIASCGRVTVPPAPVLAFALTVACAMPVPARADAAAGAPVNGHPIACLDSGDGYLRAKMAGAIDARID